MKRRLPIHLFGNRIAEEKKKLEALAAARESGPDREDLLKKIRQLDIISMNGYFLSACKHQGKSWTATPILRTQPIAGKGKTDPAHADYWTDQAIIWLQRAIETGGDRAITYELRDGRMIPKLGK